MSIETVSGSATQEGDSASASHLATLVGTGFILRRDRFIAKWQRVAQSVLDACSGWNCTTKPECRDVIYIAVCTTDQDKLRFSLLDAIHRNLPDHLRTPRTGLKTDDLKGMC